MSRDVIAKRVATLKQSDRKEVILYTGVHYVHCVHSIGMI